MTVAATSLGFAMVRLDGSIVNVALPRMGASFGVDISALQWVVNAYTLALASLLLSAGALSDRIGARRAFVWGFGLFTAGSLVCALAPSAGTLIAARAGQGAGAALLLPCSLALLNHACGDDRAARARSIGFWAAAGGVGVTVGPVLGGLLVSTLGWPSIFLVNLPIGLIGIWLTLGFTKEIDPAPSGKRLDLAGQILAIVALTALTAGVIEAGPLGWQAPLVVTGLIVAGVAAMGFVVVEARSAAPIIPLSLFRIAASA
jgi:DHA2 family methylenomycin A resistance protein-like MFS transporter